MISDPSTLLQATSGVSTFAALAFWAGADLLKMSPRAARRWALANVSFAAGTVLTVLRSGSHNVALHALADSLELVGFAFLHAGLCLFQDRPVPRREHALACGAASLAMLLAYGFAQPTARLVIYCSAASWLLGRGGWDAWRGARSEFGRLAACVISAPLLVATSLQLLRGLSGSLWPATHAVESVQGTVFNVGLNWAAFMLAIWLNFSMAGLVIGRLVARIRDLTLTDPLTGAMNRRAIGLSMEKLLTDVQRHGWPTSVICIDLDHFKALNDRHGHAAGDAALRWVVEALRGQTRTGDTVGRLGGEEFCVLLPHTDLEGACITAERMRQALESARIRWQDAEIALTASFGVATAHAGDALSAAALLDRADRAAYAAKAKGRNCVATLPAEPADCAAAPRLRIVTRAR